MTDFCKLTSRVGWKWNSVIRYSYTNLLNMLRFTVQFAPRPMWTLDSACRLQKGSSLINAEPISLPHRFKMARRGHQAFLRQRIPSPVSQVPSSSNRVSLGHWPWTKPASPPFLMRLKLRSRDVRQGHLHLPSQVAPFRPILLLERHILLRNFQLDDDSMMTDASPKLSEETDRLVRKRQLVRDMFRI